MREFKGSKAMTLSSFTLLSLTLLSLSLQTAVAFNFTIAPNDVQFRRESGTTGSKLSWQWTSSGKAVFSIAGARDPGVVLYSAEGTTDAGSITIPRDDTYILLWFNPNNSSIDVDYSSSVEAGTGSILLPIVVFLVLLGILVIAVLLSRRRTQSSDTYEESPRVQNESPAYEEQHLAPQRPPSYPPPLQPPSDLAQQYPRVSSGRFCPFCGQPVPSEATSCTACGSFIG